MPKRTKLLPIPKRPVVPDGFEFDGRRWLVKASPGLRDDGMLGETRFEERRILLWDGLPRRVLETTYLHEVLHVMVRASKLSLPDGAEETLVMALEEPLRAALVGGALAAEEDS